MADGLYALNFYSPLFVDQLKRGRKTATIRLGDKSAKYERSQIVWVTVGSRHSRREKIFSAVIDEVEVKSLSSLSPRDIERDNPEFRRVEETRNFLEQIYDREIEEDAQITVIHFSQVVEPGISGFGTVPSPN
ncbi:MAG: ASCH domain-containing protein [Solirubrobacterales bacterium]